MSSNDSPRRGSDEPVVLAVVDADHAIDERGEAARIAVGDEDPGAGIGQRVLELGLRPAEVERDLRPPARGDAAVQLHERNRVERQHRDPIAWPRAELEEHRVEPFETGQKVVVGEPDVARHQRLAIARDAYRSTQRMDERVHGTSIAHTASGRESVGDRGLVGGRHSQAMNASTFSA